MNKSMIAVAVALAAAFPGLALAHGGVGSAGGFASGFGHPLLGADHLLAMLAVGVWARQQGGRATWAVPLAFLAAMTAGSVLGSAGIALAYVEQGIVLSVLLLGLMVASALRLPVLAGSGLVAAFALLHGHAHGTEMPHAVGAAGYAAGFFVSTALLHASGVGLAALAQRISATAVRWAGAATVLGGALLVLA